MKQRHVVELEVVQIQDPGLTGCGVLGSNLMICASVSSEIIKITVVGVYEFGWIDEVSAYHMLNSKCVNY